MIEHDSTQNKKMFTDIPAVTTSHDVFVQKYTRMTQGELKPYTDEKFFYDRVWAAGRLLRRYPEVKEIIQEAVAGDDDERLLDAVEVALVAQSEIDDSLPNQKPVNRIISYINFAHDIDKLHNQASAPNTPMPRENAITTLFAREFVGQIPQDQLEDYLVTAEFLKAMAHKSIGGDAEHAVVTKLEGLTSPLHMRLMDKQYVDELNTDKSYPTTAEVEKDSQAVSEVFAEIRRSQHYGLKMAYAPSAWGGNLVFTPPENLIDMSAIHEEKIHHLSLDTTAVATVTHTKKSGKMKAIKPEYDVNNNRLMTNMTHLDPRGCFTIGEDGEIYADTFCTYPVAPYFIAQGKYTAYRQLQAELIASYFDLTQPPELVNRVTRDLKRDKRITAEPPKEPSEVINTLLLPRLKALREEGQEEAAAEELQEAHDNRRSVKLHGVTWHRRTLPEGWSASPQALELASIAGVELEPNETFVKEHKRGNPALGSVVGHVVKVQQAS